MDISVGTPQGTKLGPVLWLFYVNDLSVADFNVIKYADDTTFYKTIKAPEVETVAPAIIATQTWSQINSMTLNTDKTVVLNIVLNLRANYDSPLVLTIAILLCHPKSSSF